MKMIDKIAQFPATDIESPKVSVGSCRGFTCNPVGEFVFNYFYIFSIFFILLFLIFIKKTSGLKKVLSIILLILVFLITLYLIFIRVFLGI